MHLGHCSLYNLIQRIRSPRDLMRRGEQNNLMIDWL